MKEPLEKSELNAAKLQNIFIWFKNRIGYTFYWLGFKTVVRKSLTEIYGRPLNIAEGVHDEGLPSPGSALEPSDRVAIWGFSIISIKVHGESSKKLGCFKEDWTF